MENRLKQNDSRSPTPEELLRTLELESARRRSQEGSRERNRLIVLVAGLFCILLGAAIAFLILSERLEEYRQQRELLGTGTPPTDEAKSVKNP